MNTQEKASIGTGSVAIRDREELRMNGVKNVIGFDDGYVSLETELGGVTVEGSEMKIECLTESGEITVKGRIDALIFAGHKQKRGFLAGLLG